jgi:hypothetical protein
MSQPSQGYHLTDHFQNHRGVRFLGRVQQCEVILGIVTPAFCSNESCRCDMAFVDSIDTADVAQMRRALSHGQVPLMGRKSLQVAGQNGFTRIMRSCLVAIVVLNHDRYIFVVLSRFSSACGPCEYVSPQRVPEWSQSAKPRLHVQ